jgi:predicted pyridoxine 5'-phosphate oxidase superfamily flavin-nucleotide-binding protein
MTKIMKELPETLIEHLRQPNVVVVATLAEDGKPSLDLLSWVWPMDAGTVRLVISPNFPGGINMRANGKATLQLLDNDLSYEVRGMTRLVKESCESVRFPEAMFDLTVEEVRANMFPATHLTGPIPYARDAGTEVLHKQLDEAMYGEIRATPMAAG